jgi:methylene-fatty-acyl-phospholipid synthase
LVGAAALLSLERICYLWIWRNPRSFGAFCARVLPSRIREPVAALQYFFYGFKLLQCAVFVGWCYVHGNGSLFPLAGSAPALGLGAALLVAGQALNASVFYRLGRIGVFYGNKFGYDVGWCSRFPFSLFAHPQYAGALLSIWGFFLAMRFPHDDWFVLPALETVYYIAGAYLED